MKTGHTGAGLGISELPSAHCTAVPDTHGSDNATTRYNLFTMQFKRKSEGLVAHFAARFFAFSADATRLTGGRPINWLTALVAASSFAMSTPVAMPMPSSM